jgi:hypothetical protein
VENHRGLSLFHWAATDSGWSPEQLKVRAKEKGKKKWTA